MGEPVTGLRSVRRRSGASGLETLGGLPARHHELYRHRGECLRAVVSSSALNGCGGLAAARRAAGHPALPAASGSVTLAAAAFRARCVGPHAATSRAAESLSSPA